MFDSNRRGATRKKLWLITNLIPLLFLLLSYLLPVTVHAEITLEQWRQQATETRWLADNDPAKANQLVHDLQASLPANAEPRDQIRVLNLLARTELYQAKTELAAEHAYQALTLAEQHNERIGLAEAKINIAIIEIHRGNINASAAAVADGVTLLNGVDHPALLAELMLRLSMSYLRSNLLDESVTLALQNLEIARQSDNALALMYAYQGMGIVNEQSGRYQAANDYFQQMLEAANLAQVKRWQGQAMLGVSSTAQHLGDMATAEKMLLEAITLYRDAGFPFNLAPALHNYAYLLSVQQRYTEAVTQLEEAIAIYERESNRIGLWYTLNSYADNLKRLDRKSEARDAIESTYRLAIELDFPTYLAQSAKRMAQVATDRGDYQQAYHYITEAKKMAERDNRKKAESRVITLTERFKQDSKQRQIDTLNLQAERQETELKRQKLQQIWLATILFSSILLLTASSWFMLKLRRTNQSLTALNRSVHQSQSKLRATMDAIPDLLFVLDSEGTYLEYHSPTMSHLLYAPETELLGKKIPEMLPEDVAEVCMHAIAEASKDGLSTGAEIKLMLADGNEYWFELSVARKALMPREVQQFIGLSRDITERKKMEQELAASEQQFRALVEHSPDYIARYDTSGRKIYINPTLQRLFGQPLEAILSKSLDDESLPNFDPEYQHQLTHVLETGEEGRVVMIFDQSFGQVRYGDIRFVPEFDSAGRVMSVLAVGRDITELKEAEQVVEEAYTEIRELAVRRELELEEERKRITRNMHDELGKNLSALRLNLSVLRLQPDTDSEERDKKLQLMMALLDETIPIVRKIAAQLRPAQLQMGIGAALEWLVDDFREMTGVACKLSLDCDESHVSERLSTAIFRIAQASLDNVTRYAQASHVEISLQSQTNGYQVQIRDNGVGFVPNNVKKKSFGLLGMRERVANLGGDFEVSSILEQGTVITAFFPEKSTEAAISEV